jgi:hypothetical protein
MPHPTQIQSILNTLGPPTILRQDPQKGFIAIWGSRETGIFAIFRGPADEGYEISLIPSFDSSFPDRLVATIAVAELDEYVARRLGTIKAVLEGNQECPNPNG